MKKTIYSNDHKHLVGLLRKAREEAGLDQNAAAKRLGRSQSFISKIEAGQRRVDLGQLKEFAKIYKKSIAHFIPR